jgi:hypothetical protein
VKLNIRYYKRIAKQQTKPQNSELDHFDQMMFLGMIIFVGWIILALIFPYMININLWLILAFVFPPLILFASTFMNAIRFKSFALVSSIHHSSLQIPGPSAKAVVVSAEGTITFAIFPLHGISIPFFSMMGGGKHGYYIVEESPSKGYIVNGGSVFVLYNPIMFTHDQLPISIQETLLTMKNYKIGDPIFMCLLPPNISEQNLAEIQKASEGIVNAEDLIRLIKIADQTAHYSEYHRQKNLAISYSRGIPSQTRKRPPKIPEQEGFYDKEE